MALKVYIVANPRGIQEGVRVFRHNDREFHEGALVRDGELPKAVIADLVARGFLEERAADG